MIIQNATVYMNGHFTPGLSLRLEEGLIQAIDSQITPGENEKVIDCNGDYIIPGFVDVHIHGFRGKDTMYGEDAVRFIARELKGQGVAAFLPTTMSASAQDTKATLKAITQVKNNRDPFSAHVLGAHMEAPFMDLSKKGAQRGEFFVNPSNQAYQDFTGDYAASVRLITMAPELPGGMDFIRSHAGKDTVISIGHTQATCAHTHQAADMGATHVTHLFNAQTPLLHREPGVPGAALTDSRLFAELICDGIHLHPDIIRLAIAAKGKERVLLVTDAMEAAGMPDGEYELGGQKVFVREGAARLSSGTLAGSTLTMAQGLKNLITKFNIDPETAVWMATASPADSIYEEHFGRIGLGRSSIVSRWSPRWDLMDVFE